jgi:hypothetical protein
MDIMKIREMAKEDLPIDNEKLDIESLHIPQLHGKYLNIYQDEKICLYGIKLEYKKLKKLKWEYYTGKLDQEKLKELGWEQFDLKILRQDVDLYLEADDDLIALEKKLIIQEEKVDYLQSILKALNNRQFHIRDAISWRKFINGVN